MAGKEGGGSLSGSHWGRPAAGWVPSGEAARGEVEGIITLSSVTDAGSHRQNTILFVAIVWVCTLVILWRRVEH